MSRVAKITISLPEEVLEAVEEERKTSGESRSEFFRRASEALLRLRREQERIRQYVKAYKQEPETREEVEAAQESASIILAEEPWE